MALPEPETWITQIAERLRILEREEGECEITRECHTLLDQLKDPENIDSYAAFGYHGNFKGGLAYHVYTCIRCIDAVFAIKDDSLGPAQGSNLNKMKLYWYALCHDFNKLGWKPGSKNPFKGHDKMNVSIVLTQITLDRDLDEDEQHVIRSHHGAWGDEIPVSDLARAFHTIDMMASQIVEVSVPRGNG